mgnify:CR=1 FL=1|jgi:hypothetical protein
MLFLNLCGAGTWSRHLDPAKSQRTQHPKGLRSDARFLALLPQFNRMLRARARGPSSASECSTGGRREAAKILPLRVGPLLSLV